MENFLLMATALQKSDSEDGGREGGGGTGESKEDEDKGLYWEPYSLEPLMHYALSYCSPTKW